LQGKLAGVGRYRTYKIKNNLETQDNNVLADVSPIKSRNPQKLRSDQSGIWSKESFSGMKSPNYKIFNSFSNDRDQ
jgi:hypothetical protein